MSSNEPESVSERELADFLTDEVFSEQPRSVGEALAAAEEETPPAPEEPEPQEPEETIVVSDEPAEAAEAVTPPAEEPAEPGEEEPEGEEIEDENVAWATRLFGDDPAKWAKAAYEREQHISRLSSQLREAEDLAGQWYEYSQQVERQAQTQPTLPMSAAEEAWVEQSISNPLEFARQAAFNGNVQLYNAVIQRIAEENAPLAGQVAAQVQMDLREAVEAEAQVNNGQAQTLDQALGASFKRLGINLQESGPALSQKIGELGEYHPYVQAILNGDDAQRDLAVQALFDLVRASSFSTRKVRDEARADQIKREGELRRQAASVVTGAPHTPPSEEDPFMAAMEQEWKDRRQWGEE